jgi:hypothetical protein
MVDIELKRLVVTGNQLAKMPLDEGVLLMQMAHLGNTVGILHKLFVYTARKPEDETILRATITMHGLISRILAGVILEGWQAFKISFYGTKPKLSQKYEPLLQDDAKRALAALKDYFNGRNLIQSVRHRFAFHYDRDEVKQEIAGVTTDSEYEFLFAKDQGNSLYYAAEEIVGMAMFRAVHRDMPGKNLDEAYEKFYEDISVMSGHLMTLARHCGGTILRGFYNDKLPAADRIIVRNALSIDDVEIPYFVGRPATLKKDA